jgi:hypothetical protein
VWSKPKPGVSKQVCLRGIDENPGPGTEKRLSPPFPLTFFQSPTCLLSPLPRDDPWPVGGTSGTRPLMFPANGRRAGPPSRWTKLLDGT